MHPVDLPIVSVVIPVYNGEKYIEETIQSVLNQSLKDIEIWVINDASTDKSAQIVDKLEKMDNRIHLINKENSGVSDTRNRGIELSKGSFIAFLDQDDVWEETNLEEKVNAMLQEDKHWAFSDVSFIDENGKRINKEEKLITKDFYKNLLKWENVVPAPSGNVIASREFMGSEIRYDVKIPCPADRDICIQLARKGDPVFVNKKLWRYRIHNESMTAVNKKVATEMAIMYDKYKKENYFPDKQTKRIALSTVYLIIAGICIRFTKERLKGILFMIKSFKESPSNFIYKMYLKIK
jgi:glycosyltransferase involved in cell wall biosynthesis